MIMLLILFIIIPFYFIYKYMSNKKPVSNIVIVLVINKSLKMSKGKIISQIAHAITHISSVLINNKEMYMNWEREKKMVIYEGDIEEISNKAHINQVRYSKIHDAGRTQIPSGSNTVLIVGPCEEGKVKGWFNNFDLIK